MKKNTFLLLVAVISYCIGILLYVVGISNIKDKFVLVAVSGVFFLTMSNLFSVQHYKKIIADKEACHCDKAWSCKEAEKCLEK